MQIRILLLDAITLVLLSGCVPVIQDQYYAVKQTVTGQYYLDNKQYQKGIEVFREEVKAHPNNAEAHYYLGRFLLAEKHNEEALKHLKRAVELAPSKADHHFWLGIAYAANRKRDLERTCYLKALQIDKNHVQALTYLGHNQFEKREYKEALTSYCQALELWPANPSALYNRALTLNRLGRTPEEKLAWKQYLAYYYPSGIMGRRAAVHLNVLGDFEYRNYLIGRHTITLQKIQFEPFTAKIGKDSQPSLDVLGAILKNNKGIAIHIVAYQKNNRELAETRAKSIKQYLLKNFSAIKTSRLTVSWFDVPEKIRVGKKTFQEDESINFITAQ